MRHHLHVFLCLCLLTFSHHLAVGQNVEIMLNTDGDVALNGTKGGAKVTTSESLKPTADQTVKQRGDAKEVKIFTTVGDAQKKKQHEKLDIQIPDRSVVSLRAGIGDVTLTDIDAYVSGRIKSGMLSLKNLRGEIELVNDNGDIEATNVEAKGMLMARDGNIRLTDVSGTIAPHAPKGQITFSIGPDYYKKSPKPFDLGLSTGDIEIETAPYGGKIRLGSGSVQVSDIREKLSVEAESSTVTLRGLAAPLSLRNRGDVSVQMDKFVETNEKNLSIEIDMEGGDLTLELMEGFSGTLQIWITETNPKSEKAEVSSTLDLGKVGVIENRSADKAVVVRETTFRQAVGKGGPIVKAHVSNGKVVIKN